MKASTVLIVAATAALTWFALSALLTTLSTEEN